MQLLGRGKCRDGDKCLYIHEGESGFLLKKKGGVALVEEEGEDAEEMDEDAVELDDEGANHSEQLATVSMLNMGSSFNCCKLSGPCKCQNKVSKNPTNKPQLPTTARNQLPLPGDQEA